MSIESAGTPDPFAQIEQLALQVAGLEVELRRLAESIEGGHRGSTLVPITTLAPETYILDTPIPALVVEEADEAFVATFVEANLGASGETRSEAIDGLKDRIISTFERLSSKPDDRLGPGPLHLKQILLSLIRRL